jgi:hypothetical protein
MLKHCAQTICVVVILGGALYFGQAGAPTNPAAEVASEDFFNSSWTVARHANDSLVEFMQSPSYVEFSDALTQVNHTREKLMQTAASGAGDSAIAAQEYRAAVQRLQAALERVKERVAPGELSMLIHDSAYQARMEMNDSEGSAPPFAWELGPHAQELTP